MKPDGIRLGKLLNNKQNPNSLSGIRGHRIVEYFHYCFMCFFISHNNEIKHRSKLSGGGK